MYIPEECKINIQNITSFNISSYVRRNDKLGCVIDVMALVLDREAYSLTETLKILLDKFPSEHVQVDFESTNDCRCFSKEIGMECDELIKFVSKIPGGDCKYRLYRYAEPIIQHLNGTNLSIQHILESKHEEEYILKTEISATMRKRPLNFDYVGKLKRVRQFEDLIAEHTSFENYNPSEEFIAYTKNMIREFYTNIQVPETQSNFEIINQMRKEEFETYQYTNETAKIRKSDEITWSQVIRELGYKDEFFIRSECAKAGSNMKRRKGHKKVAKRGRESVYIYTAEDLEEMKQIVQNVYTQYSKVNVNND